MTLFEHWRKNLTEDERGWADELGDTIRSYEEEMTKRDTRWRAAILALGKRIAAHEPLYDEMAALRLGRLEDFERLLRIEVTS